MCWTCFNEKIARCAGQLGAVQNTEKVVRYLHSKIAEPRANQLKTSELFRPKNGQPSNECGKSDGTSVDRCSHLSDADIQQRNLTRAQEKAGRHAVPPIVALVEDVRSITIPETEKQAFFVYDDPNSDNLEHSVVRGCSSITGKAKQRAMRDRLLSAFGT